MAQLGGGLHGLRVAILADDGFDEMSLLAPKDALERDGAHVVVVAPREGRITSWRAGDWGGDVAVGLALGRVRALDFHALLVPGGVVCADALRGNTAAVTLVLCFAAAGKPVAAFGHGLWLPIEAQLVKGRKVASCAHLRTEARNAGAVWVDQDVALDGALVTGGAEGSLTTFCRRFAERILEGPHHPHVPTFSHDAGTSIH